MTRLVADAGGTNVRFALADAAGSLEQVRVFKVAEFPTFTGALSAYLAEASSAGVITGAAIAAAGPVEGDTIALTNHPWRIVRAELSAMIGGGPVALLNDIEAIAAALPHLGAGETPPIGAPAPIRPELRTMLALNVGTGFGAATVIRRDGQWFTCPSEAGHMSLGRVDGFKHGGDDDAEIESILSGRGLAQLATRLSGTQIVDAAEVFARLPTDPAATQALAVFTRVLGRVAGDLVLATCAWGGVYFCGSVAQAWSTVTDAATFRATFARAGPLQRLIERVPAAVVRRRQAALFGLALLPLAGDVTEPQRPAAR